jgi:coenzyme F420-0:L-glutamate ligase/coenzyme F420-1:gamma-L-glutamate ligase
VFLAVFWNKKAVRSFFNARRLIMPLTLERIILQSFTVVGLGEFPLVKVGDDLTRIIVETARRNKVSIEDGDIILVSQKVVSKAEGRLANLSNVEPSEKAREIAAKTEKDARFVELVLRETERIVKAVPGFLVVKDNRGWVCLNAGVDKSNVASQDGVGVSLLPIDPDESARLIRRGLVRLTGKRVAVIVCDTYSRPFRRGQTEFAIGVSGVKVFRDYRGEKDLFSYVLQVKNVAVVDELACAAELLMGQGNEAVPVAIVKGWKRAELCEESESSIRELQLAEHEDFFEGTL